jgi:hypothetical protein
MPKNGFLSAESLLQRPFLPQRPKLGVRTEMVEQVNVETGWFNSL